MQKSDKRILTTHVGSLPRDETLTDLLIAQERGDKVDLGALDRAAENAIRHVIAKQIDSGIDIGNDGEQPRVGFQTYVPQRMKGFGGESKRRTPLDMAEFPGFGKILERRQMVRAKVWNAPQAVAEIKYEDLTAAKKEAAMFKRCLEQSPKKFTETFMTAASPGIVATTMLNAYYESHEKYLTAIAEQMRLEYEFIVSEGFVLQLDAPDMAMERPWFFQDLNLKDFQSMLEKHVEAVNYGVRNIPPDRVRLHICWGNYDGPHNYDVALSDILPILCQAKVGALSIEMANPRHQHEYKAVKKVKLPDHLIIIPGVIESCTNYIEHPEVVADRICNVVDAVGDKTRVIAGGDCGFGTFAAWEIVAADIVWAKFRSLSEGAAIASKRLWG